MTERQQRAITNPCKCLADAGRIGLTETTMLGSNYVVTALTVDLFDSTPAWHVGVSLLNQVMQPMPLSEWQHNDYCAAIDLGKALLAGVGAGNQQGGLVMIGIHQFHLKRFLSANELNQAQQIADAEEPELPLPAPRPIGALYEVDVRDQ